MAGNSVEVFRCRQVSDRRQGSSASRTTGSSGVSPGARPFPGPARPALPQDLGRLQQTSACCRTAIASATWRGAAGLAGSDDPAHRSRPDTVSGLRARPSSASRETAGHALRPAGEVAAMRALYSCRRCRPSPRLFGGYGGSVPLRESAVQWRKRNRCRRVSMQAASSRRGRSQARESRSRSLPPGLVSA